MCGFSESCRWWDYSGMDDAEWTREGSLNAGRQVGADGIPPLSWSAHVGV